MKKLDHAAIAKAIVVYIKKERHFHDINISRESICQELGLKKTLFSQIMDEQLHMSLPEYLTKVRANYAKHLLSSSRNNKHTLEEIAFMSGFKTRVSLHRAFLNYYGMTPGEFRTLSLQKETK